MSLNFSKSHVDAFFEANKLCLYSLVLESKRCLHYIYISVVNNQSGSALKLRLSFHWFHTWALCGI